MGKNLRKCKKCGRYTMNREECPDPNCDGKPRPVNPPTFSIQDKYGKYRRKFKKDHGIL
ncbi:MAG: ribosome biogenesis protein [Candidatus Lokiarchaeota archaeon]|nr:ribosome biogenesis protein [Candidatus Lokiarchaeota archaeon]